MLTVSDILFRNVAYITGFCSKELCVFLYSMLISYVFVSTYDTVPFKEGLKVKLPLYWPERSLRVAGDGGFQHL